MCAFKKYYFLINSLKLKITEFFQFVQEKKKCMCVCACNSLDFQECGQNGDDKANIKPRRQNRRWLLHWKLVKLK